MPGSILHRTKHTLGCNNDKGSQPQKKKKIPQRYKFLHKNIVVLFDWPRIYAPPLTGPVARSPASGTVCWVLITQLHYRELGCASSFRNTFSGS